ncbi:hypothetical protein M569_05516, partial [Genlisea aurea]
GVADEELLPRYDFAPLLEFLSGYESSGEADDSPTSIDAAELRLAESYSAVPAPLWHSLLKNLCSSPSSLSTASSLVDWLRRHNICFSYELLYSVLIHALGKNEKLHEAILLSRRRRLTPVTYNALIGACARNGDLERALALMQTMRRDGHHSDFVNYSLVIQSSINSSGGPADGSLLEKLHAEMESDRVEMDAAVLNDFVSGFAKAGDADRALHFLATMQADGLTAKTGAIVSLMNELGDLGRVDEAEAIFFEEFNHGGGGGGGLKPRTKAYDALLKAYVKVGALRNAESVVSGMKSAGVSPDEQTYGLLMDAYGSAGRWDSARVVVEAMEADGMKPNTFPFVRMLSGCRDRGEWQKAFQILREMRSAGVNPDRPFYNVMIDTFGKCNRIGHMMAAFDRMKAEGIKPDLVTWNTIIDCHSKRGLHRRAEELFREMRERGRCSPCPVTYNIMIRSFGEQERWDDARDLLGEMRARGIAPDAVTYTTLVDSYGRSGRFYEAIDCLEEMKSSGLRPSAATYNALINAYAQRGLSEKAVNAFRVMRGEGLKPSILALNSLINAFGEDRRDAEAFAVLQYMKENELKPDTVTYTTLMKALIRAEKFDKESSLVPSVFEEMLASGVVPDRKAKDVLRSALKYMKSALK